MYKVIIVSLILLSCISPALAGDLGFDDFITPDPMNELREAGVLDIILKVVGLIVGAVVVAVVVGFLVSLGRGAIHMAGNNSVGATDALKAMFYVLGAVLAFVVLSGVFFYVWNGLA